MECIIKCVKHACCEHALLNRCIAAGQFVGMQTSNGFGIRPLHLSISQKVMQVDFTPAQLVPNKTVLWVVDRG